MTNELEELVKTLATLNTTTNDDVKLVRDNTATPIKRTRLIHEVTCGLLAQETLTTGQLTLLTALLRATP